MAIPKYCELYWPILNGMVDGAVYDSRMMTTVCIKYFKISEDEQKKTLNNGRTIIWDRVLWAFTYLKKAGLIEPISRGKYVITDEGKKLLNKKITINNAYLAAHYPKFAEFVGGSAKPSDPISDPIVISEVSPQEQISNAMEEMNRTLAAELMEEVMKISPYDFEKLIVRLLISMGYGSMLNNQNAVTKKSGDEGIDGVLTADKFGFDSIYIQAKQWKADSVVSRPEIQKFGGAMMGQGAQKGLFITTASFSNEAREFAKKNLSSKIVLVDGNDLANLMIEYDIGVSTVETYRIKKVDSDFFTDFE